MDPVVRKQVIDSNLNPEVRSSNLRSLLSLNDLADNSLIEKLIGDSSESLDR